MLILEPTRRPQRAGQQGDNMPVPFLLLAADHHFPVIGQCDAVFQADDVPATPRCRQSIKHVIGQRRRAFGVRAVDRLPGRLQIFPHRDVAVIRVECIRGPGGLKLCLGGDPRRGGRGGARSDTPRCRLLGAFEDFLKGEAQIKRRLAWGIGGISQPLRPVSALLC